MTDLLNKLQRIALRELAYHSGWFDPRQENMHHGPFVVLSRKGIAVRKMIHDSGGRSAYVYSLTQPARIVAEALLYNENVEQALIVRGGAS